VKIPANAVLLDGLELPEGESEVTVRVTVPRPDLYDVWIYPEAPDGRSDPPVLIQEAVSVGGDTLELRFGSDSTAVAGGRMPIAVHPVPRARWASEWIVAGPFPNPQTVGTEYSPALDSVFGPEVDPDPSRGYSLPGGGSTSWQQISGDTTGYVRLNPHFQPSDWVAAYAQAFLFSPDTREATLLLGADDAHQLWLNDQLISTRQGRNISVADDLELPVNLRQGWNRVLLKVADLDGGWAFHMRVADPGRELRWATSIPGG
jgi:hypothetical protein